MKITFSAPSKTFLIGEYAVLAGGPALVLATEPRFEFTAKKNGAFSVNGIPEGSMAWRWIEQRRPLLEEWALDFHDPHAGRGGFGASSAQFLFVHALTTLMQSSVSRAVEGLRLPAVLQDFRALSRVPASGADLLAQAVGQVAQVDVEKTSATALAWPYPDLSFAILRTGVKLATHEHLAQLDPARASSLVPIAREAVGAFGVAGAKEFCASVAKYAHGLIEQGLQAEASVEKLAKLHEQTWCLAAKGCGAMGADTLLVLFAHASEQEARDYFTRAGLEVAGAREQLSAGLEMNWTWNEN